MFNHSTGAHDLQAGNTTWWKTVGRISENTHKYFNGAYSAAGAVVSFIYLFAYLLIYLEIVYLINEHIYIYSFNFHNYRSKELLLLSPPLYREGNSDTERLNDLSEVTQLLQPGFGQVTWLQGPCS